MGPEESLEAVRMIQPKVVLPCHFNTWRPITQDAQAWKERVMKETEAKAVVLELGEVWSL